MSQSHTAKSRNLNDTHVVEQHSVVPAKQMLKRTHVQQPEVCRNRQRLLLNQQSTSTSNYSMVNIKIRLGDGRRKLERRLRKPNILLEILGNIVNFIILSSVE